MVKLSSCDYNDVYILEKGIITTAGAKTDTAAQRADKRNKQVTFGYCVIFTNCIYQITYTHVDNAQYLDKYSDNHANTSRSLWHCHKDISNDNMANSEPLKFKTKNTGGTHASGNAKNAGIVEQWNISNFWRTFEMSLFNCEIYS